MLKIPDYEFWFVAGSQFLYGEETLKSVASDAEDIVNKLNASGKLPFKVVCKGVMTTAEGITQFMKDVNYHEEVAGVHLDAYLLPGQELDSRHGALAEAFAAPGHPVS